MPDKSFVPTRVALAIACIVVLAACADPPGPQTRASNSSSGGTVETTTTTAPPVQYQVQSGDTLTAIAQRFHVSTDAIITANNLTAADDLKVGQTLVVPPPPTTGLTVAPPNGSAGTSFKLTLAGAQPGESVTFQIDSPAGKSFTGPPHAPDDGGQVNATYQTTPQDPPGTYTVHAKGDKGTDAQATFVVDAA
jgi:LysM repeat protein